MDLKPVEPEGLAGVQELRRAGSAQIQLGRCRTRLDPAPMHSSPGLSPCRASPAALALLPLSWCSPGSSAQPGSHQLHDIPSVHPQTQTHPPSPSAGLGAGRAPALVPRESLPSLGSRRCPGQGRSILLLRVPCPGLAAPPAARLRHHPGLAPAFLGHQSLQEEQERLGLHRTAPGCAPAVRPGSLPLPGRSVSFHLRWEWCSPRPVLEKSRAKRSSKAGRGRGGEREAKMAFCSFVLGWKGP